MTNVLGMFRQANGNTSSSIPQDDDSIIASSLLLARAPAQDPTPEDADSLLAREMTHLTVLERESILYDLHGIQRVQNETEEFLQAKLLKLGQELDKIPAKPAYDIAVLQNPSYVQGRQFRLLFLRCEDYQEERAASRMVNHFNAKLDLFGSALLGRTITQADLKESDKQCLYCGNIQQLPVRDRAGRSVILWNPTISTDHPIESKLRRSWYATMATLEEPESQLNGFVIIVYLLGNNTNASKRLNRQTAWKMAALKKVLPLRVSALHLCSDRNELKPLMSLLLMAIGTMTRVRARCHFGTHQEIMSDLQSFGIPTNAMPFQSDGRVNNDLHIQKWKRRQQQEQGQPSNEVRVETPNLGDILFGRGRFCQEHAGNLRFRRIIKSHADRYNQSDRDGKTKLAEEIVLHLRQRGRFLKDQNGVWVEVDNKDARKKVSMCFRSGRKHESESSKNKRQ